MPAPARVPSPLTAALVVLALVAATLGAVRLLQPRQAVVVLGDSMTAMAKDELLAAGHDAGYAMTVDGIPGIQMVERMDAIAALGHHSAGPVVIELGTNDVDFGATSADLVDRIDKAASLLTADPCVVFVNVGVLLDDSGRSHALNLHLASVAEGHANMHVYDWETVYRAHPDWSLDSVHLKPEHQADYANGIIDAVKHDC